MTMKQIIFNPSRYAAAYPVCEALADAFISDEDILKLQRRRLPGRLGQHLLGSVHGDHPVSPLRQQAGHGAGSAGQVQHRLHREGASVELPRQVVCPPAVFHIHCQGIVAGGQGVITAHLSRFLYRAKIFS